MQGISREFDWLLFTSVNGVDMFFQRLKNVGSDIRNLKGLRIGAIGPKTSAKLTALGLKVDAFPEEYRAEALAEVIGEVKGCRVLIARAEIARDILPKTLESRGAEVTLAIVYRTLKPRHIASDVKKRLLDKEIDVVTFTSSSTVDGFMRHFSAKEKRRLFQAHKSRRHRPHHRRHPPRSRRPSRHPRQTLYNRGSRESHREVLLVKKILFLALRRRRDRTFCGTLTERKRFPIRTAARSTL